MASGVPSTSLLYSTPVTHSSLLWVPSACRQTCPPTRSDKLASSPQHYCLLLQLTHSHNQQMAAASTALSRQRLLPAHRSMRQRLCPVRAASVHTVKIETVSDLMVADRKVWVCQPEDSVETALELLVEHKISGLPVVDAENTVIGVVSDFDLLALDHSGKTNKNLFPTTDETWQAFKVVKNTLAKGTGKKVKDVMTSKPLVVRLDTDIDEATSLLLQKRIRRLPVVDGDGKLVGIISRSNIIRAALELRKSRQDS